MGIFSKAPLPPTHPPTLFSLLLASMLEVSILCVLLALKVSDLVPWYWLIFHIHCWLVRVS